jgi:hypothetical protein
MGHITDSNGTEVISLWFESFRVPAAPASVFGDSLRRASSDVRFLTDFYVFLG